MQLCHVGKNRSNVRIFWKKMEGDPCTPASATNGSFWLAALSNYHTRQKIIHNSIKTTKLQILTQFPGHITPVLAGNHHFLTKTSNKIEKDS